MYIFVQDWLLCIWQHGTLYFYLLIFSLPNLKILFLANGFLPFLFNLNYLFPSFASFLYSPHIWFYYSKDHCLWEGITLERARGVGQLKTSGKVPLPTFKHNDPPFQGIVRSHRTASQTVKQSYLWFPTHLSFPSGKAGMVHWSLVSRRSLCPINNILPSYQLLEFCPSS